MAQLTVTVVARLPRHRIRDGSSILPSPLKKPHWREAFSMEVHVEKNLHLIVAEVGRWREIIGAEFALAQRSRLTTSRAYIP
jgi:hypothetical protein